MKHFRIYMFIIALGCFVFPSLAQTFQEIDGGIDTVYNGSIAWGDYDNDADLDLIISGYNYQASPAYNTRIYTNNGDATFSHFGLLDSIYRGSVHWVDIDNNGYVDILITGSSAPGNVTKIYLNNLPEASGFSEQSQLSLPGTINKSAWGDYNNDGFIDILIDGGRVFKNEGTHPLSFSEQAGIDLPTSIIYYNDWGDYDNDGDLDILFIGSYYSAVYLNTGGNGFLESAEEVLPGMLNAIAASGDYDSDGDLDIFISGNLSSGPLFSSIFKNDGTGSFESVELPVPSLSLGCALMADYDNDGDLDVLVSGKDLNRSPLTRVYANNGNDNFTYTEDPDIPQVHTGSFAWGDFDSDLDLDLCLSGVGENAAITALLRNDAPTSNTAPGSPKNLHAALSGNRIYFSWDEATDLEMHSDGLTYNIYIDSLSGEKGMNGVMADQGNGFRRIAHRGMIQDTSWVYSVKDTGTFTWSAQAIDHNFIGSRFSEWDTIRIAFINVIQANEPQILEPGMNGNLLTVEETPAADSRQWKYSFNSGGPYNIDIPGETGVSYIPTFSDFGVYYVVCESTLGGTQSTSNEVKIEVPVFSEDAGVTFAGFSNGTSRWGDYDNDGDLDLCISGLQGNAYITKIYDNNGDQTFTENSLHGVPGFVNGDLDWGDYDNDGDLDLLLCGNTSGSAVSSKVFRNNGDQTFTGVTEIALPGSTGGSSSWGDYDNDGDLDILLAGASTTSDNRVRTRVFRNVEDDQFIEQTGILLPGLTNGKAKWGDYDGDGDLDVLLTGDNGVPDFEFLSKVFRNNGNNNFTEVGGLDFPEVSVSSSDWIDYDNDGDLDVLLIGGTGEGKIYQPLARIYENIGDHSFTYNTRVSIDALIDGDASWGDYNADGYLDLIISGSDSAGHYSTKLYRNSGAAETGFVEESLAAFPDLRDPFLAWGDYDLDNDQDLILSGKDENNIPATYLFRNNSLNKNTPPSSPGNLHSIVKGNCVDLSWDPGSDNENAVPSLAYNLQVDTLSGGPGIKSPMADLSTGFRRIAEKSAISRSDWELQNLDPGTYYWRVQTVDNNFTGSAFSDEGSFTITFTNPITPVEEQTILPLTSGTSIEVLESGTVTGRQWKYGRSSGGPYDVVIPGETATSYVPYFADFGSYYVVCESTVDGKNVLSNEVKIDVPRFTEIAGNEFWGADYAQTAWVDFDNDSDLDLILSSATITLIHRNDGNNVFTKLLIYIHIGSYHSSMDWGDYDNDGDPDLLISGMYSENFQWKYATRVYKNMLPDTVDFEWQTDIILGDDNLSRVKWVDADSDGDLDIALPGLTIFRNDQQNTFTEIESSSLPPADDFCWHDIDGDGDPDLLSIGSNLFDNSIIRIFENEGNYSFSFKAAQSLDDKFYKVDFGDYNSDGLPDLLLTKQGNAWASYSAIYRNMGDGSFVELEDLDLFGIYQGVASWGDCDSDGDLDALISGTGAGNERRTLIYENLGSDLFAELEKLEIQSIRNGDSKWGDYDNDGDLDLFIMGQAADYSGYPAILYQNNSTHANQEPQVPSNLRSDVTGKRALLEWDKVSDPETAMEAVSYNVVVSSSRDSLEIVSPLSNLNTGYRKVNGPGNAYNSNSFIISDLDLGWYYWSVQSIDNSGNASSFAPRDSFEILPQFSLVGTIAGKPVGWIDYDHDGDLDAITESYIYLNGGDDNFSKLTVASYPRVAKEISNFGDFNNDGYLDLFIKGDPSTIYRRNSDLSYHLLIDLFLPEIGYGLNYSRDWGDFDNDGDQDLLFSGTTNYPEWTPATFLFRNNADETFTRMEELPFKDTILENGQWGDFDKDGDLDLLSSTTIYINSAENFFYPEDTIAFSGYSGDTYWVDYDSDGDLDVFFYGFSDNEGYVSKAFRNDGNTHFSVTSVTGASTAIRNWGDVDHDGDLDQLFTKIYLNEGNGRFTAEECGLPDSEKTAWGDYDSDGNLDVLVQHGASKTRIFRNNLGAENLKPSPPRNLASLPRGYGVLFTWDAATDDHTHSDVLSYNIRIGTSSGSSNIVCPHSDPLSGSMYSAQIGNCQLNNRYLLDTLALGEYYWSVQAIDQNYQGGDWSEEQSFVVSVLRSDFIGPTVCLGFATVFSDKSISSEDPITSWDWDFGDGNVSVQQNPSHIYSEAGVYEVQLIVSSEEHSDTISKSVVVKPGPLADFIADPVCHGDATTFVNLTDEKDLDILSWQWDLGDGPPVAGKEAGIHYYPKDDVYQVALSVLAENGCSDTARKDILVAAYPAESIVSGGPVNFCEGDQVVLSVDENIDYRYQWMIDGVALKDSTRHSCNAVYQGSYSVEVENILAGCLSITQPVEVSIVERPPVPLVDVSGFDADNCPENKFITLEVAESTTLFDYQWKRNGLPLSGETTPVLSDFLAEGNYTIEVMNGSCTSSSIEVPIFFNNEMPEKPGIEIFGPNIWYLACTNDSADQYRWYLDEVIIEGAEDYLHVAGNVEGKYEVAVSENGICFARSEPVWIPLGTGIEEDPWQYLKIYPNPTPGLFTLEMDNSIMGELIIDIFSESGAQVINIKFHKETRHFKTQIDLSGQPAGAYLIGLMLEQYQANRTLIVE